MKNKNLLGIPVEFKTKEESLEKILLFIDAPGSFLHIVSLNPEIVVIAQKDELFKKVLSEGDIQLSDGIGILLASSIMGITAHNRISGVDFMEDILKSCSKRSLRVLMIGGRAKLAERVTNCYRQKYPSLQFKGIMGIQDIHHPSKGEEEAIFSIVADYKPQIIFTAFGSPQQELWFWKNKEMLKGIVYMGVGGGFDFVSGSIQRAPRWVRSIGFEWLFRLIIQPWRFKRQLRLFEFAYLVFKQWFIMQTS